MTKTLSVSRNTRVRHVRSGFAMKYGDVEEGIANCALAWVVRGETFRDLTPEERSLALAERARRTEPLAHAEVRKTFFKPTERGTWEFEREMKLARIADHFVASLQVSGSASRQAGE